MKNYILKLCIAVSLLPGCSKKEKITTSDSTVALTDSIINYNPCTREELLREIDEKMIRVMKFLDDQNLEGILLTTTRNFSWITAGIGDNHIVITSELGPASLLIMKGGRKYLIGDNAEVPHLMDEDLNGLGYLPLQYNWNEDRKMELIKDVAKGKPIGTDTPMGDLFIVENQFARLRHKLTETEIKKQRWLSEQTAEAVASVCRTIEPGMSDRYIEAITSDVLMKKGIRGTVILIGLDDRIVKYCHFPPVGRKLEKYAFVNVCARKWGLITSVGRYVYFGKLPQELNAAVKASAFISAQMIHHTKAGMKASDMFELTKKWYSETGFPEEWKNIHSGGGIGYQEREWVATETSDEVFVYPQSFAWNPFVKATLSFHTIISTEMGIEIVTNIKNWPVIPVTIEGKTYNMPDILVRK
ncbi:MAG: M24 family metallopeptidase [Bacteroidales bacterium]|nr:M24 family metallopeptidase [Bacteroidales bacterium]